MPTFSAAPSTTQRKPTRKVHEIVAARLRQQIVTGELAEGQRLPPEDELTIQFGVARTTLREALRVLESQGLIAIKRGRGGGPLVTHPSLQPISIALAVTLQLQGTSIGDLDAARQMIEPQLAGSLAAAHTDADLVALAAVIDRAHDATERNDSAAFGLAVAAVHETLIERSGNQTLATISRLLHDLVEAYYADLSARSDQRLMRRAVRSYRKLLELIQAGDQPGAIAHWHAQMTFTSSAYDPTTPVSLAAGT